MKSSFKTIKEPASGSLVERKSEFIGYVSPVKTEEEATAFVNEIRKKHSDARHNVYAYILRENNTVRFSDDGEPHGTAGMPVLEVLRKEELTDIAVVVTRYFGGILLGTGGLVRAYTAAAKAALENAEIVIYDHFTTFSVTLSYSDYPKIDYFLQSQTVIRDNIDYGNDVNMFLAVPDNQYDGIVKSITDITNGRASIKRSGERFDYIKM